jgi:hypothetical protein
MLYRLVDLFHLYFVNITYCPLERRVCIPDLLQNMYKDINYPTEINAVLTHTEWPSSSVCEATSLDP